MRTTLLNKVTFALILSLTSLTYCTHDAVDTIPISSETELISIKTSVAPTIDGYLDANWKSAPVLTTSTEVPNAGNFLFPAYIGQKYDVTMRSLYDSENIYFLIEWNDPDQSVKDRTWYFNPITKLWKQESGLPTFDDNGIKIREAFNEDKLGLLWNINGSTVGFASQTCYASCHLHTATTATLLPTGGNHYTNGINQRIDMWHYHLMRDAPFSMISDEYQDYGAGVINANGRHTDSQLVTDGATNNRQILTIRGTNTAVTVPRWFMPNGTNYNYILASDTLLGGGAKRITAVDSLGVLYYNDSKIDPKTDKEFQQKGADVGSKGIAAFIISPMTGNRADITAKARHTGNGYFVEIKRKLKTEDKVNQDVDFSSLREQPFGIAVFNRADIAHAIRTNLVLKFK